MRKYETAMLLIIILLTGCKDSSKIVIDTPNDGYITDKSEITISGSVPIGLKMYIDNEILPEGEFKVSVKLNDTTNILKMQTFKDGAYSYEEQRILTIYRKINDKDYKILKQKEQIAKEKEIASSLKKQQELKKEEQAFFKTKAGKIYKKHPEWSKKDCQRLAEGSIWIGMDINMLKYTNGRPNSANPSNYGNGVTQWQWCWNDFTPSCYYDKDGDGKIDSYN